VPPNLKLRQREKMKVVRYGKVWRRIKDQNTNQQAKFVAAIGESTSTPKATRFF